HTAKLQQFRSAGTKKLTAVSSWMIPLVGVRGLEPPASATRTLRASQLRHTPKSYFDQSILPSIRLVFQLSTLKLELHQGQCMQAVILQPLQRPRKQFGRRNLLTKLVDTLQLPGRVAGCCNADLLTLLVKPVP